MGDLGEWENVACLCGTASSGSRRRTACLSLTSATMLLWPISSGVAYEGEEIIGGVECSPICKIIGAGITTLRSHF